MSSCNPIFCDSCYSANYFVGPDGIVNTGANNTAVGNGALL